MPLIDNGSRSIELVAKAGDALQHLVFNLGYRIAYEEFFAGADDPQAAIAAFRDRLVKEMAKAQFMKGQSRLVGLEFMEMADVLFAPVPDGHVFTLQELRDRLDAIAPSRRVHDTQAHQGHRSRAAETGRSRDADGNVRLLPSCR